MWDALQRTNAGQGRCEAFHACGAGLWIQRRPGTDEIRLAGNYCHDRFCAPCQAARAARIRGNLAITIANAHTRFITLTLRHSRTPLRDQVTRLYKSFQELKRRPTWRNNVRGGIAFLEVKKSSQDGLWHVHLHALVIGTYLDQRELSTAWHAVTGDSSIVDVRRPPDAASVAAYVTKYVTKPADSSVFEHADSLDEFVIAMKGRRLYNLFGTWRGLKMEQLPDGEAQWENVISFAQLSRAVANREPYALALAAILAERYPGLGHLIAAEIREHDPTTTRAHQAL